MKRFHAQWLRLQPLPGRSARVRTACLLLILGAACTKGAGDAAALARANLDRARALAPSGRISKQELQQAETALAAAEATRAGARSQVGGLAVRLGETRITSPLDGVVSQRRLDPGALVGPS